jgi:hypothetical protein
MTVILLKKDAMQRRITLAKDISVIVGNIIPPEKCIFFKKEITKTVILLNILQDDLQLAKSFWFTTQNLFHNNMKICWALVIPCDCPHLLKTNKMKQLLTYISETQPQEFRLIETNSQEEFPQELVDFIKE